MIVVTMGVCGSGKTSIGKLIASRMNWTFVEGDDLHPPENREKMASGTPLTDDDRWPWLDRIAETMRAINEAGGSAVVACSALRQAYRDRLRLSGAEIIFLHLTGDANLIRQRMENRHDHFMPPGLLDSQLATLEAPRLDEPIFEIDVAGTTEEIAEAVVRSLSDGPTSPC
jgi:gluconokinase